jgi:hypothetical protein
VRLASTGTRNVYQVDADADADADADVAMRMRIPLCADDPVG